MTQCYLNADPIPCICDDCQTITRGDRLDMITDIQERIDPGCIVPAGQCPNCGALAYYQNPPSWTSQQTLNEAEAFIAGYEDLRMGVADLLKTIRSAKP